jgi:glutamine amidotransferase
MHNGFVGRWARLRRGVEALIPDALYPARIGTTDSEAIFLAILGAGADEAPVAAVKQIVLKLKRMVEEGEDEDRLRFTAALTDGHAIYAFRYAVKDSANTLYYRSNQHGTVIASEPLDADRDLWTQVPENHMLIAEPRKAPQILPFIPS